MAKHCVADVAADKVCARFAIAIPRLRLIVCVIVTQCKAVARLGIVPHVERDGGHHGALACLHLLSAARKCAVLLHEVMVFGLATVCRAQALAFLCPSVAVERVEIVLALAVRGIAFQRPRALALSPIVVASACFGLCSEFLQHQDQFLRAVRNRHVASGVLQDALLGGRAPRVNVIFRGARFLAILSQGMCRIMCDTTTHTITRQLSKHTHTHTHTHTHK